MSKSIFARAAIGAALLAATALASAATVTTVYASANTYGNAVGADSGVSLFAGEQFTVDATGVWGNDPNSHYWAGPNGNTVQSPLTMDGLTTNFASLVGRIGNGPVFKIGADYTGVASTSGELEFFFWDSDVGRSNNVGSVIATTTAVPEPATFALMGLGLGLVGLSRRRKI
jgi:hypothetical protein